MTTSSMIMPPITPPTAFQQWRAVRERGCMRPKVNERKIEIEII